MSVCVTSPLNLDSVWDAYYEMTRLGSAFNIDSLALRSLFLRGFTPNHSYEECAILILLFNFFYKFFFFFRLSHPHASLQGFFFFFSSPVSIPNSNSSPPVSQLKNPSIKIKLN